MALPPKLRRSFFDRPVLAVAPELIGATLLVDGVGGVIVEVEAYHHTDPAAHSYGGRTQRNAVMFGPPGFAYIYRSYGIHWCLNFVCEADGSAAAVLVRAVQPMQGLPLMRRRRGLSEAARALLGAGQAVRGAWASPSSTTACRSTGRRSNCARARRRPKSPSARASAFPRRCSFPGASG